MSESALMKTASIKKGRRTARKDAANSVTRPRRRGAMGTLMMVAACGLIATVVFTNDLAHMYLFQTQMRTVAEAAASAAAMKLQATGDRYQALQAAQQIADRNLVGAASVEISQKNLQFGRAINRGGQWCYADSDLSPKNTASSAERTSNAVRVTIDRHPDNLFGQAVHWCCAQLGFVRLDKQFTAAAYCPAADQNVIELTE